METTNLKLLLCLILLIHIYFFTPQILSDTLYELKFGVMKFVYTDKNNKTISYRFNHKNYDGKLMVYTIQQELVKYKIENNINFHKISPYQIINNKRILNFSKFTCSVSYILKDILIYQNKKINGCIITSIRNKIKNPISKGNFLKFAYFTINPSDNILDICFKLETSVKITQSKKYLKENTTLHDFFSAFYNVDYVFNSWRDLSSIYTKNGKLLTRQLTNKVTEKDISSLLQIKDKKSFIILDYLQDSYIISSIFNF